jgi:hypothetical protein
MTRCAALLGAVALVALLGGCDAVTTTAPGPEPATPRPAHQSSQFFGGPVNLTVVGPSGEAVSGYRWLIEEDATFDVVPGVVVPEPPSVSFHKSYMPVIANGTDADPPQLVLDPSKHYFMSILPGETYAMGGARFSGADPVVTVRVTEAPLPTAQVSVFVFEDTSPINNAPDLPAEHGLAGFEVILYEAGGRYGISGGQVMQDVFANPLGTTYNPDGTVDMMGDGTIFTDQNGIAIIKNLSQGKWTPTVLPPRGEGWIQTSTIEGGRGSDAWVKPNEPKYFQEFGPPGYHTTFGFVREMKDTSVLSGGATVRGRIVNLHLTGPPLFGFNKGEAFEHTTAWIGLNELSSGQGRGVFVKKANANGAFAIPDVPPGLYQLVVWDEYLDLIVAFHTFTVEPGGGDVRLGKVPVFQWFAQLRNYVFHDDNGNGVMDPGEPGMANVGVNIRWRDGSLYATNTTDHSGLVAFNEVFPFFAWLVAEVDVARLKWTGPTVVVDAGGPVDTADPWSFGGLLTPQAQPENGGLPFRTAENQVTQGFQAFIGTTNVLMWGKQPWDAATHENGGISGVVWYDVMRSTDDASKAGQEPMEPGIPHVQVNLYAASAADEPPDTDNWPFDNFPGPEDSDWDGDGVFDLGDAVAITHTDSWDDNLPTGCPGPPFTFRGVQRDCYDGLRNFNQVRDATYDGAYGFEGIPSGEYIVEVVPPTTEYGTTPYQVTKEEDMNIDFGEAYTPSPLALLPSCTGPLHTVPDELSLFPGIEPRLAGVEMPLCDRKRVVLHDGQNAGAEFFLFTEVPIAGHIIGFILDDTANEYDPNAPTFGEKYAPPWMPVSIRDWDGVEIGRTYSDEYGVYNALVPSTFTMNNPITSGVAPKMITTCMNDPGPIPDPDHPGQLMMDPHYNPQYSQWCYTLQYTPGTTTYLDTPVIPVAAFAGPDPYPLDCDPEDGTPRIYSVSRGAGGPYVARAGQHLTITSLGTTPVTNPAYDGSNGTQPKMITRDFGFGATAGTVRIDGHAATVIAWANDVIIARVEAGTTTGELVVTRGDNGRATLETVTVTVATPDDDFRVRRVPAGGAIQPFIDDARPGDLILVPPGTYFEPLIMWKPVRLQGWGAGSTHINAVKAPAEKLVMWRAKVMELIDGGQVDLLPNQESGPPDPTDPLEPITLFDEEGSGILVLGRAGGGRNRFGFDSNGERNARIDGFSISGGDNAGGITVNGYAHQLVISNNAIEGNAGTFGGGVRLGHPQLLNVDQTDYQSSFNDDVWLHHNNINRNGGIEAVGGGVSLYTGSDRYVIEDNLICGNFSGGHGGGIGHSGLSPDGTIARNRIIFNETFFQAAAVHGGGIFIGGAAPLAAGALSPGSGSVSIDRNLIQGNGASAGDGGGIAILRSNGQDVAQRPNNPNRWYHIDITNNVISDNVAALAGGGISMQDAALVNILHDTIAHNDSTATAGDAFVPGDPRRSVAQPAGIVSRAHSADLAAAFGNGRRPIPYKEFANPLLVNDIIWQNRSFTFRVARNMPPPGFGLLPDVAGGAAPVYWDYAVLGTATAADLAPVFCDLTFPTGAAFDGNFSADPLFVAEYVNGSAETIALPEVTTGIQAPPAFDEGGNFIKVRFGPITLADPVTLELLADPHLLAGSPALARGLWTVFLSDFPQLAVDYDGVARPAFPAQPTVGALE